MHLAVDFHVHWYSQFNQQLILKTVANRVRSLKCDAAVLFLTERLDCSFYQQKAPAGAAKLLLHDADGLSVLLVPGFQCITQEGLEVHALNTLIRPPEKLSLAETVKSVIESGARAVIPFGVGKWFGRRGKVLDAFLNTPLASQVFLSDSRHRPLGWPTPRHFSGRKILNGSDPLDLSGEERALLSFGSSCSLPVENIEQLDIDTLFSTPVFANIGHRVDPFTFAMLQTKIRLC